MPTKKKSSTRAGALLRTIAPKTSRKIGKRIYDTQNPEKASQNKRKKSNTTDKRAKPTKKKSTTSYRKTKAQGTAELKKLRAKQKARMK